VKMPEADPVEGRDGALVRVWGAASGAGRS
jgi:hypothetical protein